MNYPKEIEQIHNEVLNAVEIADNNFNPAKASRLAAVGFRQSLDSQRLELIQKAKFWQRKYPLYRFIDSATLDRICEKYGLIIGAVGNYTGFVPDKNLREIENFKVADEDISKEVIIRETDWDTLHKMHSQVGVIPQKTSIIQEQMGLEIAAPAIHMQNSESDTSSRNPSVVLDDPIVLQPVYKDDMHEGYLIVTAWGDEASDPEVINPASN